MLKHFVFAAGTLLVATIGVDSPAAAAYRAYHGHRVLAAHGTYPRKTPVASQGYRYQRRAPLASRGYQAAQRARLAYGRGRIVQNYRPAPQRVQTAQRFVLTQRFVPTQRRGLAPTQQGRFADFRTAYRRRLAVRNVRMGATRRDSLIRNYVGSRSAYTPVASAPVAAGAQTGSASYYSGGRTASGGVVGAATCAHRTLPFGTRVLVTNLANARRAVLTVNDRGPFIAGRIVDVSTGAAGILGMLHSGTAPVRVQVVGGHS